MAIWYHDPLATGANNGTSWADAFTDIFSVNSKAHYDTVLCRNTQIITTPITFTKYLYFIGCNADGVEDGTHAVFDFNNTGGNITFADYTTYRNLTFKRSTSNFLVTAGYYNGIYNCLFENASVYGMVLSPVFMIDHCIFRNTTNFAFVVYDNGTVGSFSVSSASISSVTPTSLIGGVITITGAGFGTLSDETAVVIGGYCCEIISWEDTEIVAIVSNSITAGVYDVAVVTSNASCAIEEDAIDIQVPSDTGDTTYVSTTGPDGKDNSAFVVSDGTYKSLGDVVLTNGVLILWCTDTPEVTIGGNSVTMTRYNGTDTWDMYYASNVVYNGVLRLSATGSDKSYADIRGYNRTVSNGALKYLYNDMVQNSGDSTLPWF